jgi:hypothetical protein
LGLSAGAASRGNEIECRLVGVARSVGDDSSKGAQGCSPRPASESRRHSRPHGQAVPRQYGGCGRPSQDVFKVPSSNGRDQGARPLASRTQGPSRRVLHLADAPSRQRGLDMWSLHLPTQQELLRLVESTLGSQVCTDPFACRQSAVAPRFATPLHCRHSAAFNGLLLDWSQPVTLWLHPPWHLLPQVLEKLRASRARGILVYPFWPLQPWFQDVQRLSALHFSLPPPRLCVRSHHPGLVEPFVNREVRLWAVVFDCA